jgi:hypothetical protein
VFTKKRPTGKVAASFRCLAAVLFIGSFAGKAQAEYPYFYGGNAHPNFNWSAQQMVDYCHQHGMRYIREDCSDTNTAQQVETLASGMQSIDASIHILACLDLHYNPVSTESMSYNDAYNNAVTLVNILKAGGITDYECGNELTDVPTTSGGPWYAGHAGDKTSDFTMSGNAWQSMRGEMRGMIDAVHAVNRTYRAGIDFSYLQTAGADMLWNGTQPDGGTGPTVRWDVTMWHNYGDVGSMFTATGEAHSNWNAIAYIWNAYKKPIMITEWNGSNQWTDAQRASYTSARISEFFNNRFQDHIEAEFIFAIWGDPAWGLQQYPQQQAALDAFDSQNPVGPTTSSPLINQNVTLQALANGEYVCADNAGSSPLIANRTTPTISLSSWEMFKVIDQGYGYVSLQSLSNLQYVCVGNGGSQPLIASTGSYYAGPGSWEAFLLVDVGGGNYALQSSANSDYVCADNAGANPLIANRTSYYNGAGSWELFNIVAH